MQRESGTMGTAEANRLPHAGAGASRLAADPETLAACPSHVGNYGRELWGRLTHQLAGRGAFSTLDLLALECLCSAYDDFRRARAVVDRFGATIRTGLLVRTRPEVWQADVARQSVMTWLTAFGSMPTSRQRVSCVACHDVYGEC